MPWRKTKPAASSNWVENFYIFQTVETQPSYLPELKAVKEAVEKSYIAQEAKTAATSAAKKYLEALKKGEFLGRDGEEARPQRFTKPNFSPDGIPYPTSAMHRS